MDLTGGVQDGEDGGVPEANECEGDKQDLSDSASEWVHARGEREGGEGKCEREQEQFEDGLKWLREDDLPFVGVEGWGEEAAEKVEQGEEGEAKGGGAEVEVKEGGQHGGS